LISIGIITGVLIKSAGGESPSGSPLVDGKQTQLNINGQKGNTSTIVPNESGNETVDREVSKPVSPKKNNPLTYPVINEKKSSNDEPYFDETSNSTNETVINGAVEENSNYKTVEQTDNKSSTSGDLSSLVTVKANGYTVGSFGGINNLKITLKNNSKYSLDLVTVAIQYLKPRDEILKTDLIQFQSVAPGGTQTLPVRKSNRGVKVSYRIIKIESKQFSNHNL
jgi:hypothetical protein